jgi:hypothetical protein
MFGHQQEVLLKPQTNDLNSLAGGPRNETGFQVNTALHELPEIPDRRHPRAEVDADSESPLLTVPSGIEDMPGRTLSQNACLMNDKRTTPNCDEDQLSSNQGTFSVGPGLRTECPLSPKTPEASFKLSAEARDGTEAAAVLLAEGSYEQAFSLYSHWSKEAWASRTDDKARQFLVSLFIGMSLSASTLPEVLDAGSKMKQLIDIDEGTMWLGSKSEVMLYTYMAILLLRFQWMPEVWDHLEHASYLINRKMIHGHPASEDWRATTSILRQIAGRFSYKFCSSSGKDFSKQLQNHRMGWLSVEHKHDKLLHRLFHCCVSMLELADFKLQVAEELNAYPDHGCISLEIKSALHMCLFRHFWRTFAIIKREISDPRTDVVFVVRRLSGIMQVGCVDLFAVTALALIDMTSPLPDIAKQRSVTGSSESSWSVLLLQHIHRKALDLVAGVRSPEQLTQWFLAAHASITLTRVEKRSLSDSANPQSSFIREALRMPVASESSRQDCARGVAFRTEHPTLSEDISPNIPARKSRIRPNHPGTFLSLRTDPPLNPTPGTSWSSGFRSMLSLQRRIQNAGVCRDASADGSSANLDFESDHHSYRGSLEHWPEIRCEDFVRESW